MRARRSLLYLVLPFLASGTAVNSTIDDSSSAFTFSGPPGWNTITPTSPCDICSSQPNASLVYDGTWHDGNIRAGASPTTGSFTFTGNAVYIYGIDQAESQADLVFTLGNIQSTHHYTGTEQYSYNALFFSATGLDSGSHTVTWSLEIDTSTTVVVQVALFDYAIVTSDDESSGGGSVTTTSADSSSTTSSSTLTGTRSTDSTIHSSSTRSSASSNSISQSSTSSPLGQALASQTVTISGSIVTIISQPSSSVSTVSTIAKSNSHLGPIVGGVVGTLFVAALAICLLLWRYRHLRRSRRLEEDATQPRPQFLRLADYHMRASILSDASNNAVRDASPHAPLRSSLEKQESVPQLHTASSRVSLLHTSELESPTGATSGGTDFPSASAEPSPVPVPERPRRQDSERRTASHRDLSHLEQRLATLEAQIAEQQQPPPYLGE